MQESPRKTEAGKTAIYRRGPKGVPVMSIRQNINCDEFMLRQGRAANRRVPERAAVPRGEKERLSHGIPQGLQAVEKSGIMPVRAGAKPPAAATGQFRQPKIRPSPSRTECMPRV